MTHSQVLTSRPVSDPTPTLESGPSLPVTTDRTEVRTRASITANPWMPVSRCDDSCMPPAGSVPTVGALRAALRLVATGAVLVAGASLTLWLPLLSTAGRQRAQRRWCRALLTALQVRVQVRGDRAFAPHGSAVLVVSNHVSWLDVIALNALHPLRMVTRSDVRDWAVIGRLVTSCGAHYIDRARLSTLPHTVTELTASLRNGSAVGAFPEGTTWCGRTGGRFRPALFQAAIDAGAVIRPVAVNYRLAATGAATTAASFVGDATLWHSLVLMSRVRGLVIDVLLLPALDPVTQRPDHPAPARTARRALAVAAMSAVHGATHAAAPPRPSGRVDRAPERAG